MVWRSGHSFRGSDFFLVWFAPRRRVGCRARLQAGSECRTAWWLPRAARPGSHLTRGNELPRIHETSAEHHSRPGQTLHAMSPHIFRSLTRSLPASNNPSLTGAVLTHRSCDTIRSHLRSPT
eukprot:3102379-Rhodomonas_salina.4